MSVHKYSVIPDSNTIVGDGSDAVGIQEGMARQSVNNAMRAIASDIAKNYKDHGSLVTAGTGSAYTVFAQSDFTAYFVGLSLVVKLHADCGPNATINVNGRGVRQLRMRGPNGVQNVEANALRAHEVVHIIYNGTQFHVVGAFDHASVLADISAIQDSFVPDSRKVIAGTGLTGGGALNQNRTLSAKISSQAAAVAGVSNEVLMTPLSTKRAINQGVSTKLDSLSGISTDLRLRKYTTFQDFDDNAGGARFFVRDGVINVHPAPGEVNQISLTLNGNQVWHAGNDGPNSGLNADLLDGHHASAFATPADIAALAANSATPADIAGLEADISTKLGRTETAANSNLLQGKAAAHFVEKVSSRATDLDLDRYAAFLDYDDRNPFTGVRTFVRDGVWNINANSQEINPIKIRISGQTVLTEATGSKQGADYTATITPVPATGSHTSFAHGLFVRPAQYWVVLKCLTAQAGYTPGDEVILTGSQSGGHSGLILSSRWSTTIGVTIGASGFFILSKNTGTALGLANNPNWSLTVKAKL